MNELYGMLLYIFLPLFISWLFKQWKFKRLYLTYIISGLLVIIIPIGMLIMRVFYTFVSMDAPDSIAFAHGFVEMAGNIAITLFVTLFFQYIFNKTMGLNAKVG